MNAIVVGWFTFVTTLIRVAQVLLFYRQHKQAKEIQDLFDGFRAGRDQLIIQKRYSIKAELCVHGTPHRYPCEKCNEEVNYVACSSNEACSNSS